MTSLAPALLVATTSARPHKRTAPAATWAPNFPAASPAVIPSVTPASPRPRVSSLAARMLKLGDVWSSLERQQSVDAPTAWPYAAAVLGADTQDVAASMVLCEAIYRAADFGTQQAELAIQQLQQTVPAAPRLHAIQWSPPGQQQQYVVAETEHALVVAFLGTKRPADHLVNLRLRHAPLFGTHTLCTSPSFSSSSFSFSTTSSCTSQSSRDGGERDSSPSQSTGSVGDAAQAAAMAHSGYLARAASIPAEQLYQLACVQGKRLVLAGHSLGGAVATLCTLRLLDALPAEHAHSVTCVGFAVPPVGNAALAQHTEQAGWAHRISNYLLPEDWVPGLLGRIGRQNGSGSSSSTSGSGGSGAVPSGGSAVPSGGSSGSVGAGSVSDSHPDAAPPHEWVCWGYANPASAAGAAAAAA